MKGDIYLGVWGSEYLLSAHGRTLSISDKEISRSDRTASGRLVRDIVAVKKEFTLDYELIDGLDLELFIDLYDLHSELSMLVYPSGDAGTTTTTSTGAGYTAYTVLMNPIDRERLLLAGEGMWSGVTIQLEEV